MDRRQFLYGTAAIATTALLCQGDTLNPSPVLGHGDFQYRQIPNWGALGDDTPVKNCHGIVEDADGHIILLTDETHNNVIVYSPEGKLVSKWGNQFPGAHGLSIVKETSREVLYITDTVLHKVFKTTLDGVIENEWGVPTGPPSIVPAAYRPSWTLHDPGNDHFFVLNGYGTDEIIRYDQNGKQVAVFGGQAGGIARWGPHGGIFDDGRLLIAMSDQEYLMSVSTDGEIGRIVSLHGGNPRQIHRKADHYFVAHLADNWSADTDSRGFVSVLNSDFEVVSNIGGTPPQYDNFGRIKRMSQQGDVFLHPHDLVVGRDESLYVAQYNSNNTYPLKFERV